MRPDVSILGYDLRASGVVRNALRIAGAAASAGLVTELWTARDDGPLRDEIPAGVTLRSAGHASMKLGRTADLARSVPALSSYLKQVRPRIALSSGNHMHFAAELAHALAGRPTDVRLWARASNATLKHPIGAYLGRDLPALLASGVDAFNRLQYRGFDHVIAVCHELGGHLIHELGIPPERLSVIANGVSISTVRDKADEPLDHPWMQEGAPPVIVSAGRFSKQKNFADLIRALAIVRRDIPAHLLILGDGTAAQRTELENLAASLGLAESVLLPGFDPNPWRWMRRAALFAVSSRWEGSSNVVLEALACGTPVVAYRCPTGIAEVVEPLGTNLVVAPGDNAALAAAILRRIAEPRNSASQEAQAEKFDLSHMLDAYVALFIRTLKN
jgi:glycosyltransferase involved in cell wall biosynthesis